MEAADGNSFVFCWSQLDEATCIFEDQLEGVFHLLMHWPSTTRYSFTLAKSLASHYCMNGHLSGGWPQWLSITS